MKKSDNKYLDESLIVTRTYEIEDIKVLEARSLSGEEDKNCKRLEGHPAIYNSKTNIGNYFYEVIERGAFEGCDFDDVLFFINHNTNKIPLARSRRNNTNSTMEIKLDNIGLFMRADIDIENNSEAKQLYSSVSRGDINGMSFMFRVKEQKWENLDTDMPTRRILKVAKVFEVSAVNQPAYDQTDINARDKRALDNALLTLDNARSHELDNSKALDIEKLRTQVLLKI